MLTFTRVVQSWFIVTYLLEVNTKLNKQRKLRIFKHLSPKMLKEKETTILAYKPGYSRVYTEGDIQNSEDFHRKPIDEFPEGHWVIPPPEQYDKFKNPGTCQTDLVNHLRGKWIN